MIVYHRTTPLVAVLQHSARTQHVGIEPHKWIVNRFKTVICDIIKNYESDVAGGNKETGGISYKH